MNNSDINYFIEHVQLTEKHTHFSEQTSFKEWLDTYIRYQNVDTFSKRGLFFLNQRHSIGRTYDIKKATHRYLCEKYNISNKTFMQLIDYVTQTHTLHYIPPKDEGRSLIQILLLYHKNNLQRYTFDVHNPQLHNPEIVAYLYRELLQQEFFMNNEEDIARVLKTCIEEQHPLKDLLIHITRCPLPLWFQQYLEKQAYINTTNPFMLTTCSDFKDATYHIMNWMLFHSPLNVLSSNYQHQTQEIKKHYTTAQVYLHLRHSVNIPQDSDIIDSEFYQDAHRLYHKNIVSQQMIMAHAHQHTISTLLSMELDESIKKMIQWKDDYAVYMEIDPTITLGDIINGNSNPLNQETTIYL